MPGGLFRLLRDGLVDRGVPTYFFFFFFFQSLLVRYLVSRGIMNTVVWCGVAVVLRAFRAGKKGGRSAHWGGGWCRNFPKLVTSCLISKFAFFSRHCYSGLLQGLSGLCLSLISHTYTHIHTPYMSITSHHEDKARSHTVDSFHPELSSWPIEALLLLCNWGAFLNVNPGLGRGLGTTA